MNVGMIGDSPKGPRKTPEIFVRRAGRPRRALALALLKAVGAWQVDSYLDEKMLAQAR